MRTFLVYALRDPVSFERRYIGMTGNLHDRFKAHRSATAGRNPQLREWLDSLRAQKMTAIFEVLCTCGSQNSACEIEAATIAAAPERLLNRHSLPQKVLRVSLISVKELTAMQNPTVPCPSCCGTGRVKLATALSETLVKFTSKAKLTSGDLKVDYPDITPNAINNRLEILRKLGFLTRVRDGRLYRYQLAKAGANGANGEAKPTEKPSKKKKE